MSHAHSDQKSAIGGVLYVVATPIGNLGDLTSRAREVLARVDVIAAEDTRHTRQLLQSCGIEAHLVSMHEHNEAERVPQLIANLRDGKSVALVSDAGTPLISDPGYRLVREAAVAGIPVRAVPGACAAIAALSIAALPSDRFSFEGFLPAKASARRERLTEIVSATHTLVFYEAPHRLRDTLTDMAAILESTRNAVVARELTKTFETVYRGTLEELKQTAAQDADMHRGEIVIVVEGQKPRLRDEDEGALNHALDILLKELPVAQAAELAAKLTGANRNRTYKLALLLSHKSPRQP